MKLKNYHILLNWNYNSSFYLMHHLHNQDEYLPEIRIKIDYQLLLFLSLILLIKINLFLNTLQFVDYLVLILHNNMLQQLTYQNYKF